MSSIKWFYTHDASLNTGLDDGEIVIKHLVPNQKSGKYTHKFASLKSQSAFGDLILKTNPKNCTYYELLSESRPQKMFADLDSGILVHSDNELVLKSKLNIAKEFEVLLEDVFISLDLEFSPDSCKWLVCSGKKLSLHFCYPYIFADSVKQREFWDYVTLVLTNNKDTHQYDSLFTVNYAKGGAIEPIIDLSVYSRNRALRTIYSHKGHNTRVFLPYNISTGIELKKEKINILEYMVYAPNDNQEEDIIFPIYSKEKSLNYDKIIDIITAKIPEITLLGVESDREPPLIKFMNYAAGRACIFGPVHKNNGCHVLVTPKGLLFRCKSIRCEDKERYIHYFIHDKACTMYSKPKQNILSTNDEYDFFQSSKFSNMTLTTDFVDNWISKTMKIIKGRYGCILVKTKIKTIFGIDYTWDLNPNYKADLNELCTLTVGTKTFYNLDKYIPYMMGTTTIKKYQNVYFSPDPKADEYGAFNTFNDFTIKLYLTPSTHKNFLESYHYTHLRNIMCNGEEKVIEWLFDWIAMLFQDPHKIPGTVPVFISDQGTGKGLVVKFIENIIDERYVLTVNNTATAFSNFNSDRKDKLLICLDEISTKGAAWVNKNMLKGMITDEKIRLEEKYKDARIIRSFAHYIITTNNEGGLYIENSDRRFCFIQCNNKYANNKKYIKPLIDELNDVNFLKGAYCYFSERKYDVDRVGTVPMTNLKIAQLALSLPNSIKFIIETFESTDAVLRFIYDSIVYIKPLELHRLYNEWCEENNVSKNIRISKTVLLNNIQLLGMKTKTIINPLFNKKRMHCIKISLLDLEFNIQSYTKNKEYKICHEVSVDTLD